MPVILCKKLKLANKCTPSIDMQPTQGQSDQKAVWVSTGPSTSAQREDGMQLDPDAAKRFYLQYFFPPSCVGETGRVGGVSRRELGHGSLAERGLAPTIPSEVNFPPASARSSHLSVHLSQPSSQARSPTCEMISGLAPSVGCHDCCRVGNTESVACQCCTCSDSATHPCSWKFHC